MYTIRTFDVQMISPQCTFSSLSGSWPYRWHDQSVGGTYLGLDVNGSQQSCLIRVCQYLLFHAPLSLLWKENVGMNEDTDFISNMLQNCEWPITNLCSYVHGHWDCCIFHKPSCSLHHSSECLQRNLKGHRRCCSLIFFSFFTLDLMTHAAS